jgi:TetR/AcrR family transcriptional regulator, transcriptional repressor for nem operon
MGHSKRAKDASHDRILSVAARRFRERGFDGVSIADLMTEAGLTHGGFYKHFPSRDALLVEATARCFRDARLGLTRSMEKARGRGLEALLESYLSSEHEKDPGSGCPVAALAVDISRTAATRQTFAPVFAVYVDRVASMLDGPEETRPGRAAAIICAMAGAIAIARALGDSRVVPNVLAATHDFILSAATADRKLRMHDRHKGSRRGGSGRRRASA